jgi:hypothetical protein
MKTADVIIYGCSFYDWKPFNEKFKPGALVGIMHVGSMYRGHSDYYNKTIHPKLDFVVVSYDFQDVCPGSIVVLNPIDETKYTPVKRNDTPPVLVGHSPSGWGKKLESGVGRILKGTHHLTTAMEILNKKYGDKICVDIIQGVSLPNCLARKKRCHIFFDQIGDKTAYKKAPGERPLYGTSLAEAAFFGSICLSHADIPNSPLYCVKNSDDVVRVISYFMDNPEQIEIVGQKTREWALQNLSYESVGKKFIADLEAKIKGGKK